MQYELTTYTLAQILSVLVSLIAAGFIWQRRASRGGWPLFLLFIMVAEWALANAFEAAALPRDLKIFWSKVAYLGTQASPVLLVLFALKYIGMGRRLTPITTGLLFFVPVVIVFLAATNESHGLIWTGFLPGPPGTNSLIYQHGIAYWVAIAYIIVMISVGTVLLIHSTVRSHKVFRQQGRLILVASLLPWLGFLMYVLNLNPFPGLDTVSISFVFTGLVLVIGINRGYLLDIIPVAHELIVENIKDGLLVVDERFRIIDLNQAAAELLGLSRSGVIGTQIQSLEDVFNKIEDCFDRHGSKRADITINGLQTIYLDTRISPLHDRQRTFLGWVVFLVDISTQKKIENDLNDVNWRLKKQLTNVEKLRHQLKDQAIRDPISGVYNRRYLEETLFRELSHARRDGYEISIIMLDIDHFKKINDRFGHRIGDDVIVALGKLLQQQTRQSDCVSRYGGDEFVLVLPEMSAEDAFQRAELWREAIKSMIFQVDDQVVSITVSLGISTFPENGQDNEALLKAADDALYHAKRSGRDRSCAAKKSAADVFSP